MSAVTETMTDATNVKGSTMKSAIGSTLASANAELLRLKISEAEQASSADVH